VIRPANADSRKLITGATSVGLHRFPVGHGYTVDEDGPDGFGSPSLALVPYVPTGSVRIPSTKLLVPPFVLDHGGSTTYQLEVGLDDDADSTVGHGESAFNVTMTDAPRTSRSASAPRHRFPSPSNRSPDEQALVPVEIGNMRKFMSPR
jgi:hypothetical protein